MKVTCLQVVGGAWVVFCIGLVASESVTIIVTRDSVAIIVTRESVDTEPYKLSHLYSLFEKSTDRHYILMLKF